MLPSTAASGALTIDRDTGIVDLAPHVDILPDREGLLRLPEVLAQSDRFSPFPTDRLWLAPGATAYWLRFSLDHRPQAPEELFLSILPSDLDYIDLFQVREASGEIVLHRQAGLAYPRNHDSLQQANYLFTLPKTTPGATTYYLRLQSDKAINLSMRLSRASHLLVESARINWWAGHLFGILTLLILVNLSQIWRDKSKNPLWYSGFLLMALLYIAARWGYINRYLPDYVQLFDLAIALFAYGTLLCYSEFSRSYFKTRKQLPKWDLALRFYTGLTIGGFLVTLLIPRGLAGALSATLAILGMLMFFTLGIFAVFQGMRRAHYYTIARVITTPIMLCYILSLYQILPWSYYIVWLLLAAIALEGIVMTYTLVQYSVSRFDHRMRHHYETTLQRNTRRSYAKTMRQIDRELRTPISGVIGMAELLLDTSLTRSQRDQVQTIRRSGHSLLKWLTRLCDWSNLHHDRIAFDSVPFELKTLMEEFAEDCREQAEDRKVRLTLSLDPRLPELLQGDPHRLKQILTGIFEHALYYSEQGTLALELRPATEKNTWEITLADDQSGLQPEEVAALTNAGAGDEFIASQAIAPQFVLPQRDWFVAQRLAVHMGGDITLSLAGDAGARYTCRVQIPPHTLLQRSEADYNDLLRERRLLVVDDSASSRKVVSKRADRWGMRVSSAPSGREALAILHSVTNLGGHFDLIILDHNMPGMSGLELAERIDRDPKLRHTPMIMLSGAGSLPSPEKARAVGISQCLKKPVSARTLKITLAEELTVALARRGEHQPAITARSRAQ
ncbi:hybrid sensor histidine kinase/response regulator [Exilibacterium tricleocarpae]|nr:hybrid sensor histidine kinase/response regulator [Exilibacterium tricleocarpae]